MNLKDLFQKKSRRADTPALFMAGGIAASLLLLAFVLQAVVPGGRGISQKMPTPDFARFLPPGSTRTNPVLEIADLPQPSYVVSYMSGGLAGLLLVDWDREAARYTSAGTLTLAEGPAIALDRVESLELQPLGLGAPTILVRGPSGVESEGAFLVAREKDGLKIVRSTTDDGLPWPAFFRIPAAEAASELTFDDADGDTRKEAILTTTSADEDNGLTTVTKVYRWDGAALVFDGELSRLLSLSKSLFPEPDVPATE